jgi:hypothetical protein
MARRPKDSGAISAFKGRFYRNLEKILNADGKGVPKKFLLGTNMWNELTVFAANMK